MAKSPRDERNHRQRYYMLLAWICLLLAFTAGLLLQALLIKKPKQTAIPDGLVIQMPSPPAMDSETLDKAVSAYLDILHAPPKSQRWDNETTSLRPDRTLTAAPEDPFLNLAVAWDVDCEPRAWLLKKNTLLSINLRNPESEERVILLPAEARSDGDLAVIRTSLKTEIAMFASGDPLRIVAVDARSGDVLWEQPFPNGSVSPRGEPDARLDAFIAFGEPWVAAFRPGIPGLQLHHAETGAPHFALQYEEVHGVTPGTANEIILVRGVHAQFFLDHRFRVFQRAPSVFPQDDRLSSNAIIPRLIEEQMGPHLRRNLALRRRYWDSLRSVYAGLAGPRVEQYPQVLSDFHRDWVYYQSFLIPEGSPTNADPIQAAIGSHELLLHHSGRMTLQAFGWTAHAGDHTWGYAAYSNYVNNVAARPTSTGHPRIPFCGLIEPTLGEELKELAVPHDPRPFSEYPKQWSEGTPSLANPLLPGASIQLGPRAFESVDWTMSTPLLAQDGTTALVVRTPWRDALSLANERDLWLMVLSEDGLSADLHLIPVLRPRAGSEATP